MLATFAQISERLTGAELRLGKAELGETACGTLAGLRVSRDPLILKSAKREGGDGGWLEISGVGQGLLGADDVPLRLLLLDSSGERILMMCSTGAVPDKLTRVWLSLFESDPLAIFSNIGAAASWFVASADLAAGKFPLPPGWGSFANLPAGVTLLESRVVYDAGVIDEVKKQFGVALLSSEGATRIQVAADTGPGGPILRLSPERVAAALAVDWLRVEGSPPQLLMPLESHELSGPRLIQSGKLAFDGGSYEVEAEFDLWSETATISFKTSPGLGVFQKWLEPLPAESFGTSLLKGVMGEAWIQRAWSPSGSAAQVGDAVLAIGGAVRWDESAPIVLIPGLLDFAAALEFQVEHPFTPELREPSGSMEGSLRLLRGGDVAARFTGSLELPGWSFAARAEATNLQRLWQAFGSDVRLPAELHDAQVSVDLWGGVESRSFGAEIRFKSNTKWPGAGGDGSLEQIALGVSYDNGTFAFGIEAKLRIKELVFEVAGGYEQGGWYLRGGMAPGATLDVSQAVNSLLKGLSLPEKMPAGLKLADVGFAANFSTGYISVRGHTDGNWPIANGIGVGIRSLSFERSSTETLVSLIVGLEIEGALILLEAAKGGSDKGWIFKGGTAPGVKLRLAAIYAKLSGQTEAQAKQDLPDALKDFSVDGVAAAYDTTANSFEAACSGHLTIEGRTLDATATFRAEKGGVRCQLVIALDEKLIFTGAVDLGAEGKSLVLTFRDQEGRGVPLIGLLSKLLPSDVTAPPVEIMLKQALLAYCAFDSTKVLVLGAAFDLPIDLGDALPSALEALVGRPEIGVKDLRVLYASADLPEKPLGRVNERLRTLELAPLPAAEGDGKKAGLAQGFHASGQLKFGGQKPVPLALPVPSPKPKPAEDAPAAPKAEAKAAAPAAQWIEIGKSLGPLWIGRVGGQYADGKVGLLLDVSVDLAGLHIGLTGFAAHIPLKQGAAPTFGLDGLELAYAGGPIEIAGGLLCHRAEGQPDSYEGSVLIKTPPFSIAGMGSISTIEGAVSVFIFAALNAELGGPPAFRLQGIAGGFGYNRRLILPPVERVSAFPFVRAAMGSFASSGKGSGGKGSGAQPPGQGALQQLRNYIPASRGDYWLAAGIKFNSFEMITGVALVSVSFGNDVEIGLLGLAEMSLPRGMKGKEVAYIELALRCSIKPSQGTIIVEGRLTDACYILSKDCRITGGFAFCLWFSGPHAGDFVLTLGGYHPDFQPPKHYPAVPRLGVQWQVTKELSVSAELYFALTPSCIMAGGRLAAIYQSSSVRAWFIVSADFLIAWEPLRYSIKASLGIGFEVDVGGSAVRIYLQAELRLWGPPFAGQLHVDLGVAAVTVDFGEAYQAPKPLDAKEFRQAFLPKPTDVVTARVESGLLLQETREGRAPLFVVTAHALRFSVESAVPLTELDFVANGGRRELAVAKLGVNPMAKTVLRADLKLSIASIDAGGGDVLLRSARVEPVETGVPEALWRPANEEGKLPEARPSREPMKATTGVRLSLDPIPPAGASAIIRIGKDEYADFARHIPALDRVEALRRTSNAGIDQAMSKSTADHRGMILSVLAAQRWPALEVKDVDLTETAKRREECFRAEPKLWALGQLEAA